jgi:hypothetical protein
VLRTPFRRQGTRHRPGNVWHHRSRRYGTDQLSLLVHRKRLRPFGRSP